MLAPDERNNAEGDSSLDGNKILYSRPKTKFFSSYLSDTTQLWLTIIIK